MANGKPERIVIKRNSVIPSVPTHRAMAGINLASPPPMIFKKNIISMITKTILPIIRWVDKDWNILTLSNGAAK